MLECGYSDRQCGQQKVSPQSMGHTRKCTCTTNGMPLFNNLMPPLLELRALATQGMCQPDTNVGLECLIGAHNTFKLSCSTIYALAIAVSEPIDDMSIWWGIVCVKLSKFCLYLSLYILHVLEPPPTSMIPRKVLSIFSRKNPYNFIIIASISHYRIEYYLCRLSITHPHTRE